MSSAPFDRIPPPDDDLCYWPATEVLGAFRRRKLSPVEYLDALITRARTVEPLVNAFSFTFFEQAREEAVRAADRYLRRPEEVRSLEGLPVAVKELAAVAGQPHTLGSLVFEHQVAETTDPALQRVLDAGAIVHARTNTPEFGCASFTHSRLFGTTANPWNRRFSPAGSSGGAAAALASGTTPLAQGSDSAGSLRLPASACGVFGLKAAHGRIPLPSPMNADTCTHHGPMARNARDLRLLYEVMVGPHPADLRSWLPEDAREGARRDGLQIGIVSPPAGLDVDGDVLANNARALSGFEDQGHHLAEVDLTWDYEEIIATTLLVFGAVYGPRVRSADELGPGLLTDYAVAFMERVAEVTCGYDFLLRAHLGTANLAARMGRLFTKVDVLALPTLCIPAPEVDEPYLDHGPVIEGREQPDRWIVGTTVPFNLVSMLPALNVPSGVASTGVPTGLQLVGSPYREGHVLALADDHERVDARDLARRLATEGGGR